MDPCVFCEIVSAGSRHEQVLFEDDAILVILDDFPLAKGHALVILKRHLPDLSAVSSEAASMLGKAVARVAAAIKAALDAESVYVASVGEQVRHVHYHVVPRYSRDSKGFCHFMSPRGKLRDAAKLSLMIRERLPVPEVR